ncbi:MAG: GDYXXLXY domain-containing protein [Agriterribacter sp.]
MKILSLIIFGIAVIAQWAVPGVMIRNKEKIIWEGKVFHFRTAPVDPTDPFRGKYVSLNFKENHFISIKGDSTLYYGNVYVILGKDRNGFAIIKQIVRQQPVASIDYVKASIAYTTSLGKDTTDIHINYPFDQFYMDEFKAPKAERVYRESSIDSSQKTYAVVSILNGEAAIRDVMINDKPIRQVIKEMEKK